MTYIFLLLFSGCSLFWSEPQGSESAKGTHYQVNFRDSHWKRTKSDRSDYVFEHTDDGRILLSNSFCQEFQEQPLEQLAAKTFKTVNEFTPDHSSSTTFHQREAFILEGSGRVDGVWVNLRLLNTRRNNCYFDFLAISPINHEPLDRSVFDQFLKSVVFK
jgi:hypothetical protein